MAFTVPDYVQTALDRLRGAGFEAYCVGGGVRDLLLGAQARDWDVATSAAPDDTARALEGFRVHATGARYGSVTAVIGGNHVEITTFRSEKGYGDGRRPDSVEFISGLRDDLLRRDFTMNALALLPQGEIVDICGGVADIEARLVRAVGSPAARFGEDALRILRALRFASTLRFSVEEETASAILSEAWRLRGLSAERVNSELTRMLCGAGVGEVLRGYAGALVPVLPEIEPMFGFNQRNRHHCHDVWEHTVIATQSAPAAPALRWAALLHDIGKPGVFSEDERGVGHFYGHARRSRQLADDIMRRLKFDAATHRRVLTLIERHDDPVDTGRPAMRRLLETLGEETLTQLLQLKRADNLAQAPAYRYRQGKLDEAEAVMRDIIAKRECFSLRDLAVNGDDLVNLGLRGEAVGAQLRRLLGMVQDDTLPNDRARLLGELDMPR
jgi:tRNA nucleotidyltransferase (CCA-adding enzyme)